MPTNQELSNLIPGIVAARRNEGAFSHDVHEDLCAAYGQPARPDWFEEPPSDRIEYMTVVGLLATLVSEGVLRSEPVPGNNRRFFLNVPDRESV